MLCEWVLQLLQRYGSARAGVRPLQAAAALRRAEADERGRELRALLRLLQHLTQRDLLDFGGDAAGGGGVDIAQVAPCAARRCAPCRACRRCTAQPCAACLVLSLHSRLQLDTARQR